MQLILVLLLVNAHGHLLAEAMDLVHKHSNYFFLTISMTFRHQMQLENASTLMPQVQRAVFAGPTVPSKAIRFYGL